MRNMRARIATSGRVATLVIGGTLLIALAATGAWAGEGDGLGTVAKRKAAVACQKLIAKTGAAVIKSRTKALEVCGGSVFKCLQLTDADPAACLADATTDCSNGLKKAGDNIRKLANRIAKNAKCSVSLTLVDLLSVEGL